jgi:hypothetical protein
MKQRFHTIRSGTTHLDSLCSPAEVSALPFPQSFAPLPTDRFSIKADGTFDYMGRDKFNDIYQLWHTSFVQRSGLLLINVYGTPGFVRYCSCGCNAIAHALDQGSGSLTSLSFRYARAWLSVSLC